MRQMARLEVARPLLRQFLSGLPDLARYLLLSRRMDRRFGTRCPSIREFFINRQALNLVYTSRAFQPGGEALDESFRFVGPSIAPRNDPVEFPFAQLDGRPLIYISMGTLFNDLAPFYRTCFAAFTDTPYQVVLSIGRTVDEAALGTPPPNFIVRRYVPQLEILQLAALFITHGGMNSVSEALLYHVPLLVVPQAGDQYVVGARVAALGAGRLLPPTRIRPERLREQVEQLLLNPDFRRQSQKIGESLRAAGGYLRATEEIAAFKGRQAVS